MAILNHDPDCSIFFKKMSKPRRDENFRLSIWLTRWFVIIHNCKSNIWQCRTITISKQKQLKQSFVIFSVMFLIWSKINLFNSIITYSLKQITYTWNREKQLSFFYHYFMNLSPSLLPSHFPLWWLGNWSQRWHRINKWIFKNLSSQICTSKSWWW